MNWQYLRAASMQEKLADAAAATSTVTAGWTWLASVNEVLQIIATIVAISAGVYAIRYHRKRLKALNEGRSD